MLSKRLLLHLHPRLPISPSVVIAPSCKLSRQHLHTMPARKRAAAEIHEEKVAVEAPAASPSRSKKRGTSNGVLAAASTPPTTPKKSPRGKKVMNGKAKAEDDTLSKKIEEEVERLADAAAATSTATTTTTTTPTKEKKSRKKEQEEDPNRSLSAPPPGGSKMDTLAAPELPKNMTIDDPLTLDDTPKKEGTTRIASWNILSLKSCLEKGLMRYIQAEQADVLFMTETKCNDVPLMPVLSQIYPHQTWGIGEKKGYAGIALLSKVKPIKVTVGIPGWDVNTKARIITAEYARYIVIGTYVVNAGENLKTLPQKQAWNEKFAQHLAQCDARKPTIWTGDLNVVLDARDLSNASKKWNKSAGYTEIECEHHRNVLLGTAVPGAQPYVDIWRERHPDAVGHYSYYGFRGMCRSKGIGWRLDSFIIPQRIADQVTTCEIRHTIYGASDHLPVYMDIKGDL